MIQKLCENNIDYEEHLDVNFNKKKATRSNSPTIEGTLSTLTTEIVAKDVIDEKSRSEYNACTTDLSGPYSDDKYSIRVTKHNNSNSLYGLSRSQLKMDQEEIKDDNKVVRKHSQRNRSDVSSNSSNNILTSRTAPIMKANFNMQCEISKESQLQEQIKKLQKDLDFYKSQYNMFKNNEQSAN